MVMIVLMSFYVFIGMLVMLIVNEDWMVDVMINDFLNVIELVDYFVNKGILFWEVYVIVGKFVLDGLKKQWLLQDILFKEYQLILLLI